MTDMKRLFRITVLAAAFGVVSAPVSAAEGAPARAFSCFKNSLKNPLVLRLEWADKRFAIFAWPAGKTQRVYVGSAGEVRWCWGKTVADVNDACPAKKRNWVVRNNCN
jgi:hypothetical protein